MRGWGVGLLALGGAAVLAGCGERTLDNRELEATLKRQLDSSAGVTSRAVLCPNEVPAEKGRSFACTLIAPNGDEVLYDVTLTNDEGGFEANVQREQSP